LRMLFAPFSGGYWPAETTHTAAAAEVLAQRALATAGCGRSLPHRPLRRGIF